MQVLAAISQYKAGSAAGEFVTSNRKTAVCLKHSGAKKTADILQCLPFWFY